MKLLDDRGGNPTTDCYKLLWNDMILM